MFFGWEHLTPNASGGCQVGKRQAEGFDGHPTVVAHFVESFEGGIPIDVAFAGGRTVVFGDMHVHGFVGTGPNGFGDVFLFDIRV